MARNSHSNEMQIRKLVENCALTTRKTGKRLLIPIAPSLREHLIRLEPDDNSRAPVHPRAFETIHAQNGRVGTLSNQFADLLVAAGLRPPQTHQSRGIGRSGRRAGLELSFHCLRHTAVSLLKDAGVPDSVVMALVGHESAAMSHRYTHVGACWGRSACPGCTIASRNLKIERTMAAFDSE
jgi:integrase